jgi:hypothetical protein
MENKTDKVIEVQGKKYLLRGISGKLMDEASRVEKITFSNALREGALTVDEATKILKDRKIVDSDSDFEYTQKLLEISKLTIELSNASDTIKPDIFAKISNVRTSLNEYNLKIYKLLSNTAEHMAKDAADAYLASKIICDEKGVVIFKDIEDLKTRAEIEPLSLVFMDSLYFIKNIPKDFEAEYPENKLMKEAGFVLDQEAEQWTKPGVQLADVPAVGVEVKAKRGRKRKVDIENSSNTEN